MKRFIVVVDGKAHGPFESEMVAELWANTWVALDVDFTVHDISPMTEAGRLASILLTQ